uniref:hypothetical protein n=1 Tax=Escherichia coli TaxID=562 RepID=UPI001BC86F3D
FLSVMSADRMLILFLIFTFSYKFLLATSNKKMIFKNELTCIYNYTVIQPRRVYRGNSEFGQATVLFKL